MPRGTKGLLLAATGLLLAANALGQKTREEPPGAKAIFLNPFTGGLVASGPSEDKSKTKPPTRLNPTQAKPQPRTNPIPQPERPTPAPAPGAPVRNLGLRYWIDLMDTGGDHHEVTRERIFHSSERIQLRFQSNASGYIALYQLASSGKATLLFPDRDKKLDNRIDRDHPRALPKEDSWFRFDKTPGVEHLFVVFTRTSSELETLVARRLLEYTTGSTPRGDQIASKDLILETAPDGTYAVNLEGAPIELEIQLQHE